MRTLMLAAVFAAALAITAGSPGRADAQVFDYPTVGYSPYSYRYWNPGYNYAYAWSNPYYTTYSRYWGSPYTGNYNWQWVTPNYYYGTNYLWPGMSGRPLWRW